jgi:polar amino acid transport system substrate-binding protein
MTREAMKKICIYVGIALICFNTAYAGDNLKISAPPSIWVHKQGEILTGPVIDLLEEIFSEFKVTVTPKILPWARAIAHMKSGELDMIPVIFYTDERARFMVFTISYIEVPTAIFVPAGKRFPYTKLDDLKGRRGLMMRGDSISPEFEAFQTKLDISKVAYYEQAFKMLANNRADYAVAAQYGFLIEAKKLGYEDKIEMLPVSIASRSLHFAFSKKSPFLKYLPKVNKKLKQLQADGTMRKMANKAIRMAADK